jgi:CDP-6-deoxy-D-xylo-4-hexulose-3-dehydrase
VRKCDGKVELRPIVGGDMTKQPFFTKYEKRFGLKKSNAGLIHEQGLYFGNNPELTAAEKKEIIAIFTK